MRLQYRNFIARIITILKRLAGKNNHRGSTLSSLHFKNEICYHNDVDDDEDDDDNGDDTTSLGSSLKALVPVHATRLL